MKLMLIVPEYPPYHVGGGGIVYENLAKNLKKSGYSVVVIWGYYPTNSLFECVEPYDSNGIMFYKIPEIPFLQSKPFMRTAMPPNIKGLLALPTIIKRENPDIVHIHGYGLLFINFAAYVCRLLNKQYIFTIHGYPKTPETNQVFNLFWRIYEKVIMTPALKSSMRITCVSRWLANDERLKNYQDKVKVIYNGIETERFSKGRELNEITIYRKYGISENSHLICSVGRISRMKGFHKIIKIIPKLLRDFPNLYYFIVGADDGYQRSLEQQSVELGIQDRIIFTGFVDELTKLKLIKESDAYIVPSLWEPFGLTALEGLAMEKMVITSGAGGLHEFLSDSRNVLFFSLNDDNSIENTIKKVLNREVKYRHDDYINKFNWENIVKEYINVYKQIVEKSDKFK